MNILLLTRYGRLGASSRVRFEQYVPYIREAGHQVAIQPLFDDDYLRRLYAGDSLDWFRIAINYCKRIKLLWHSGGYDLVWLEAEVLPWLPTWGEAFLNSRNIPYVVDYDDAIFHRYNMHQSALVRTLLGRKIDKVMRRAALVVGGSEYLVEYAVAAGAQEVVYLPTVVDMNRYSAKGAAAKEDFTIGWIGSPMTVGYLSLIETALAEIGKEKGVRVVLVGGRASPLKGVHPEIVDWAEAAECSAINLFDVGIMPLPDSPWERGKCGYKLIQYMASGIPVVASPVGANCTIVDHGVDGFLADTPAEWINSLRVLKDSPQLRAKLGSSGRAKVRQKYSLQTTAPRLIALLSKTAG